MTGRTLQPATFLMRGDKNARNIPPLPLLTAAFSDTTLPKPTNVNCAYKTKSAQTLLYNEADSNDLRQQFEADYPKTVEELKEKEEKRRDQKRKREEQSQLTLDV